MNKAYGMTSKFQITIPKQIREQLHIKPTDRFSFAIQDEKLVLDRIRSLDELAADMHQAWVDSGLPPATDEDIKNARGIFNKNGGKW